MKALTIKEPWVSCILYHGKRIENRSWRLPHGMQGQTIALHTSKKIDRQGMAIASSLAGCNLQMERMPLGAIVGIARITSCVALSQDKWFFGPWGFVLDYVVPLQDPIPARGQLAFWNVADDVEKLIKKQIDEYVELG